MNIIGIKRVVDRAIGMGLISNDYSISLRMDMDVADMDVGIDFDKLMAFDDFNFRHDVVGIANNVNRSTLKLDNCFSPRCTKESVCTL